MSAGRTLTGFTRSAGLITSMKAPYHLSMPLDPATENFLGILRSVGAPPLYEGTVEAARAGIRANTKQLPGSPEHVHRIEDRTLPGSGADVPVRLYWPRAAAPGERLPIVINF